MSAKRLQKGRKNEFIKTIPLCTDSKRCFLWFKELKNLPEVIKEHFGQDIVIAEIGVYLGENAQVLLRDVPNIKKMFLVDPYEPVEGWIDNTIDEWAVEASQDKNHMENIMIKAKRNLSVYKDKIEFIRLHSLEAAKVMEDESLDLVYIDGDHHEEAVKKDILAWWPKVKKGGILCGDDYGYRDGEPGYGVKAAVDKMESVVGRKLVLFQHTIVSTGNPVLKKIWAFFKR